MKRRNSYTNDVILTNPLLGLKTREFREKVLQKGDNITLDYTFVLLESLEHYRDYNAKLEKDHGGSVAAVEIMHGAKDKGGDKKSMCSQKGGAPQGFEGNKKGRCCGSTERKGGFLEWKDKCKLLNHKCTKCGRLGHSKGSVTDPSPRALLPQPGRPKLPSLTKLPRRWLLCWQRMASSAS